MTEDVEREGKKIKKKAIQLFSAIRFSRVLGKPGWISSEDKINEADN